MKTSPLGDHADGNRSCLRKSKPYKERPRCDTREPCALKGASTVRRGEVRKGLSEIPPEGNLWQVRDENGTSLAPYPTSHVWGGSCKTKYEWYRRRLASNEPETSLARVRNPVSVYGTGGCQFRLLRVLEA